MPYPTWVAIGPATRAGSCRVTGGMSPVAGPIATHVGYGIATAATYQWLRRRLDR